MKNYINKEIPARVDRVQDSMSCDFCGRVTKDYDWSGSYYEVNETKLQAGVRISHKEGHNYGYDGNGEEFSCDMCPECFRNKLVPFLQSISKITLKYEDYNY